MIESKRMGAGGPVAWLLVALGLGLGVVSSVTVDAWREASGVSSMTDLTWNSLTVDGAPRITTNQMPAPPALAISCFEHQNVAAVFSPWEVQPSLGQVDKQKVRVRFDDASPVEQLWYVDDDRHTLMTPDPLDLAMLLRHSERMLFEYTTVEFGRQVVEFEVRGFDPDRGDLSLFCSWPSFIAEAITVTGEALPSCDLRPPKFSASVQKVLQRSPFDLLIEAEVGSDGELLSPTVAVRKIPTEKMIETALFRAVRLSKCEGRPTGDRVRLRYRYSGGP